jgi:hypothetical protein
MSEQDDRLTHEQVIERGERVLGRISEAQLREMARRIADEYRAPREHDGLDDDLAEQHARLEGKAGRE